MITLTPKQRAHLRSLAHGLRPRLQVGKEGVTQASVSAVEAALGSSELLKLRVLESAPQTAKESAELITGRIEGAHLVQVIGRTVVLYRPHPEKPEIKLPRGPRDISS